MFLHVTRVQPLGGHRLYLEFNEGTAVEIELRNELHGEVFEPLQDPVYFRKVHLKPETGTVEWPNGADFAPEFLMEAGPRSGAGVVGFPLPPAGLTWDRGLRWWCEVLGPILPWARPDQFCRLGRPAEAAANVGVGQGYISELRRLLDAPSSGH